MEYYLKPNAVIEPLFDSWYAWSHLIAPSTASMNIANRHLKIIDSFIQAPDVHAIAVKNPRMRGGPFMDLHVNRVDEVKSLRKMTTERQADLLEFSTAINELSTLLKTKARGFSLDELYPEVPEILKGYVELVYDLNNNPSFRFFESLLYKSKYYKTSSQSISLWITNNDERPFVLSTPRLDDGSVLRLNIPFSHPGIDELSRMKRKKGSLESIQRLLGLKESESAMFQNFFTQEEPPTYQAYQGAKVRMRYFGHACILVETQRVSILLDPVISYYGYQCDVARFSDVDLPDTIDYVLITHNHQDHVLLETLLPLRHKIKKIVIPATTGGSLQDPSLKLMFKNLGFRNVVEISELDELEYEDIIITGIPFIGEHSDLNIQAKLCYHIKLGGFKMLFVADSCNIEPRLYDHVQKEIGDVDVVFIGMECDGAPLTWLYGPLLSNGIQRDQDQSRRLAGSNFDKAKALVDTFRPREVYVYAMGQEPWLEYISSIKYTEESNPIIQSDKLIGYCKGKGIISERLFGEKEILYSMKGAVTLSI